MQPAPRPSGRPRSSHALARTMQFGIDGEPMVRIPGEDGQGFHGVIGTFDLEGPARFDDPRAISRPPIKTRRSTGTEAPPLYQFDYRKFLAAEGLK